MKLLRNFSGAIFAIAWLIFLVLTGIIAVFALFAYYILFDRDSNEKA